MVSHLPRVIISVLQFDFLDVVLGISEGSLPVIFIEIRVVIHVQRTRTRCWVSVLNLLGQLVVMITLDAETGLEGTPCVQSSFIDLTDYSVYH